jgi:hypothetical protein
VPGELVLMLVLILLLLVVVMVMVVVVLLRLRLRLGLRLLLMVVLLGHCTRLQILAPRQIRDCRRVAGAGTALPGVPPVTHHDWVVHRS